MSKLILDLSVSLDGYVAGPNQTLEEPLGEGGIASPEVVHLRFRVLKGEEQ